MTVSNYSTTASSNTSVNGINISEGMSPSDVNNAQRSILSDTRSVWNDKEWFILGDGDGTTTFTRASTTTVTISSNITSTHHVGRRVKIVGSNTGTIFGKISASAFSSPNTTLTFVFDSGSLNSGDTTVVVYVGSVFTNPANPVVDEDNMASNSAILPPSQQSVKAFVENLVTGQDLDVSDGSTAIAIDLDSETLGLLGGTGIDSNASGNNVTIAIDSTVATKTGTETLTNKTLTSPVISSISNSGTLTLPTSSDTLVGRSTTDTLANKTITTPVINQISNTGTISFPTSTDTLIGKATTDTLTNKTISGSANTLTNIATSSLSGTISNSQLGGSISTDKIGDSQITTAKVNNDAITIDKIADAVIVTNSEQASQSGDDNTFFTTQASDSRYFRQDSSETIDSGDTWSASDSFIATTAAIDARVIDLVDDVGGFFPIANETSFPNTNPDVNDGAGTIVSIKALSQVRTADGSGVISISSGTVGGSTVTINGLTASQTLGTGFGILVETTSTLNTYTFHREIAPATSTSTVAGVATEISRLGTTSAVEDLGILGTSSNVTSMANVSGSISNVNSVASGLTNINTVASNISGVNSFGERYRVASSAPSSSLDSGDLYFDTSSNILKVYGSSGWQSAGSSVNGTSNRFKYIATSNQTTFTGSDANSQTLSYDAGFIDVYKNGIRMINGTDVTVTSGSSIVFASACAVDDVIEAVAFGTFSVASLNASDLDSGTVNNARLPSTISDKTILASALTAKGDGSSADGFISLNCSQNSHGVKVASPPHSASQSYTIKLPDNQIAQDKFMKVKSISGSGATAIGQLEFADVDLANLSASNLTSGTVPTARLGSGTASSSTFLAGDQTFKTITGTTINNNADNRLITGSGTANTLEGESDLTFNGSTLICNGTAIFGADATGNALIKNKSGDQTAGNPQYTFGGNGDTGMRRASSNTIAFDTNSTERMRIDSSGNVGIGEDVPEGKLHIFTGDASVGPNGDADELVVEGSGSSGISILSGSSSNGNILFGDSGGDEHGAIRYLHASNALRFDTNDAERMRIDSSGNVLFNTTDTTLGSTSDNGVVLTVTGEVTAARAGNVCLLNRLSSDGSIIEVKKDGSTAGNIGNFGASNMVMGSGICGIRYNGSNLTPFRIDTYANTDDALSLGHPSIRWDNIYATSGTVNTSDQNEKQSIQLLTTTEIAVAKRISKLFKTFKFNSAVEKKGANARTHTGIIAQDVQQAFTDEGLDASNYGLFTSDTWWEKEISVDAVAEELDKNGNVLVEGKDAHTYLDTKEEVTEGYAEKTRLGIRYPELLCFISNCFEKRLTDIETRLTTLEG